MIDRATRAVANPPRFSIGRATDLVETVYFPTLGTVALSIPLDGVLRAWW